jgi:hypothetical protein
MRNVLLRAVLLLCFSVAHGAMAQALWENSTTNEPVRIEFGPEYTMTGDVRVQKVYTDDGTKFPHVFLPVSPLEVYQDPSAPFQPEIPGAPMRLVQLSSSETDKQKAILLEQAEGKHVEITYNLGVSVLGGLEPVELSVSRIKILGDAKNSK